MFPLSLFLSRLSFFFSVSLISRRGAFVCLAKPVFDRAGLRAAISGPCAPSSIPLSLHLRVPHIRYGTCNVLNSLLSLVHSDDPFFPRELVGRKIFPDAATGGDEGRKRRRSKNRQKIHLHYETLSFFTSDLISSPRPFWGITMHEAEQPRAKIKSPRAVARESL